MYSKSNPHSHKKDILLKYARVEFSHTLTENKVGQFYFDTNKDLMNPRCNSAEYNRPLIIVWCISY